LGLFCCIKKKTTWPFLIILVQLVAPHVLNIPYKFQGGRSSRFWDIMATSWKKVVSRKTRLKVQVRITPWNRDLPLICDAWAIQDAFLLFIKIVECCMVASGIHPGLTNDIAHASLGASNSFFNASLGVIVRFILTTSNFEKSF